MEVHEAEIRVKTESPMSWGDMTIFPIGDLQYGAQGVALDDFRRHIKRGLNLNAYFVGMGDYGDFMSPSNRSRLAAAGLYDWTQDAIDDLARLHMEKLCNVLKDTKDKWLGMLSGHHFYDFPDGTNSDQQLCRILNTRYLGDCASINLKFKREKAHGYSKVMLWLHHGSGSSQTLAGPLPKLERLAGRWPDVDIFLVAHYHRQLGIPLPKMRYINHKWVARDSRLVLTGGWLRGYTEGSTVGARPGGSYVERAMMPPLSIGAPIIHLMPTHKQYTDYVRVEVTI